MSDTLKNGKGTSPSAEVTDDGASDDGAAEEAAEEPEVKPYTGEYEIFVDRKAKPIPTLLGYVNVTEEDETVWDPTNHIRLCLQIW